ncbi:MAG: M6 family metalloprotease domain-containing protein [Prevotella sp.]|nr:M6 family metalloprotease domain-containing protein [Prevotella sp.]
MTKPFFSLLAFLVWATNSFAVPAISGLWQTLTLTDGKQLQAQLMGDEHLHFWQSASGDYYVADGDFYRKADAAQLIATSMARRTKANLRRQASHRRKAIGDFTTYKGEKRGLVILVDFNKCTFQEGHDKALYKRILNEEGFKSDEGFQGSVYDYFKAQSYGQFELTFDVVGPVHLNNTYAYYGQNGDDGNDMRAGQLVAEVCRSVNREVNFANYDWDGNGYVDQVLIIYAGRGENEGGGSNAIWPHEWELTESDYGSTLSLDGVLIDTYAVVNECSNKGIAGIGTICHEFSHCLGLPDMYDIYSTGNYGMGSWSVMANGNYNSAGFVPAAYTSFERYTCGWVTPIELNGIAEVKDMLPLVDAPEAYIIRNDKHPNEYLLLENRQQKGWDAKLPGSGLLILHVDYDRTIWENNIVNTNISDYYSKAFDLPTNDHQHCTIYRAGNRYDRSSFASDAYPYGDNTTLCNTSRPAAKLFHPNSDGSLLLNKGISNITRNADGTIAFRFYDSPNDPGTIVGIEEITSSDGLPADNSHRLVISKGRITIDGRYDLQGRALK